MAILLTSKSTLGFSYFDQKDFFLIIGPLLHAHIISWVFGDNYEKMGQLDQKTLKIGWVLKFVKLAFFS